MSGTLYGPAETTVTLQNNLADDLAVTTPGTIGYESQDFSFATPLTSGSSYSVSVFGAPANQTCSVYAGDTGTVPTTAGTLKVGCERIYELLTLNPEPSYDVVIGGADIPIGRTATAYGEGRYVAWVSYLEAGPNGSHYQIWWYDRQTGNARLVSHDQAGLDGNSSSGNPAISADGQYVAFRSVATNLVTGDTNNLPDIFVWSAATDEVSRINVGDGGVEANGDSLAPTISGDGSVVAFSTYATNLAAGISDTSSLNIIRRDMTTGSNTLVSANSLGTKANNSSNNPTISEDGDRIAFWSNASDLVSDDTNGTWDIFVHTHSTNRMQRVSLTSTGGERGTEETTTCAPAISGNGRYVAYETNAANIVPGDTNGKRDVFVVDTQTGGVVRASLGPNGEQGNGDSPTSVERPALSHDGTWVAFRTTATNFGPTNPYNIVMRNLTTGKTLTETDVATGTSAAAVSRNGAYVAFYSEATLDDHRFPYGGVFARYTGQAPAFFWR